MFKITIERTVDEKKMVDGVWDTVDWRLVTIKDMDIAGWLSLENKDEAFRDQLNKLIAKGDFKMPVKGYAPRREATTVKKEEVFSQTVENLDFVAVVKAINGI